MRIFSETEIQYIADFAGYFCIDKFDEIPTKTEETENIKKLFYDIDVNIEQTKRNKNNLMNFMKS